MARELYYRIKEIKPGLNLNEDSLIRDGKSKAFFNRRNIGTAPRLRWQDSLPLPASAEGFPFQRQTCPSNRSVDYHSKCCSEVGLSENSITGRSRQGRTPPFE